MRKVSKIEPISPSLPTRKKVAAYARVSMETERLNHSLSAQVSYYSNLIQSNPEWEYAGVYADNAVTGTKSSSREEFQRMLEDCEAGKIDIILTKSISRFARNTVDLLETVRHLKELGIEVRFEKEHINSLSGDGEVIIPAHHTVMVPTGIAVALPEGTFGGVFARSGLASRKGLRPANCVGVVDSDYRGECFIALHNDTEEPRTVRTGERIAQLVLLPYLPIEFDEVTDLPETARGEGGFGSTGR